VTLRQAWLLLRNGDSEFCAKNLYFYVNSIKADLAADLEKYRSEMPKKTAEFIQIPQFALYGESTPSDLLEFVHIEDIHERSARNRWVIKPHRHTHLFQVLCMTSGAMQMRLDDNQHALEGAWAIVLPAGVVHGFEFRPDTKGVVLSLAVNLQGLDAENQMARLLDDVLASATILRLRRNTTEYRQLVQYLQLLKQELAHRQEQQALALFALVKLVLVNVRRLVLRERQQASSPKPGVQLTDKFRQLLEAHYKQHWQTSHYAEALHVSVSTLNRACTDTLGDSAKKLAQLRLHVESKRRLIYTRETLDQIAFDLGFQDAGYFSRVFKAQEAISPKQFRLQARL
jgi:AraC family transcriptional regulator, transcriptional activator of pobA